MREEKKIRAWVILFLTTLAVGGTYYVYDSISPLQDLLRTELGFTPTQYGFLFSSYSFLNTFLLLALFGGIILDIFGIKKTGFLFVAFCTIGTLITAYGASDIYKDSFIYNFMNSFWQGYSPELKMMVLGRIIFGLGAETLIVVQNKIISKWFKGDMLALAFALNLAVCRLGTAAALIFSPKIALSSSLETALWVAGIIMLTGFVAFVGYMIIDNWHIKISLNEDERVKLKDLTALLKNREYIFISLLCVTFYSAVFPFQSFAPDILHNKFNVDLEMSGLLTSIIIWGTIIFTPLFGYLFDKFHNGGKMMLYGSALLLVSHTLLAYTYLTPYFMMFTLGIAFSLVPAAMWPSVALIVEEEKLGMAFGLMTSLQNLGLWAFPIIAGYVTEITNPGINSTSGVKIQINYSYTMTLFVALAAIAIVFSYYLSKTQKLKEV
ncbi:MAG: MFS transporter [Bacteroidales bacterium]|nr:MFS transporter [Bacteroidales bacterium]